MLKGLHPPQGEPSGAGNSSGSNTVLNCLFNLVTPLSETYCVLWYLGTNAEVPNFGNCDECRWNYMPFTHEVPGSSPGGSNMRGHSSMVERDVSSNLVVAINMRVAVIFDLLHKPTRVRETLHS